MTSCQVKDSSIIDSSIGDNNNTTHRGEGSSHYRRYYEKI